MKRSKSPENKVRFRGLISYRLRGKSNQTRESLHPSFIQTVTVGSGVPPDHALWSQEARVPVRVCFRSLQELALALHSARGLYHRSVIAPCPEGFYLVV